MKLHHMKEVSYRDNGFGSAEGMAASHRVMIDATVSLLDGQTGNILDLGCGNGLLLAAIAHRLPGVTPMGVERARDRANRARATLEQAGGHVYVGDIFSLEQPWFNGESFLLTILMIGRLLEVDLGSRRDLIADVERHTNLLLLYTYGDSLSMSDAASQLLSSTFPGAICVAGIEDESSPRLWVYNVANKHFLDGTIGK
jgi:hypothetical protein